MIELAINNLTVTFPTPRGLVNVVKSVSFNVGEERLGIVGESGSGKSMTARAILGLVRSPGKVTVDKLSFNGKELNSLSNKGWREIRGRHIAMIMQDPKFSLNPVQKIGNQIAESALLHDVLTRKNQRSKVMEMLENVGIDHPERIYNSYPHQLSGGIGQRVMIAAMLMSEPELLIADEPTSALDVMVRGQVLEVMDQQIKKRGMGLLIISHDLNMVANFCDRVIVMYRGEIVDVCAAKNLYQSQHPYTQGLLNCLPHNDRCGKPLKVLNRQLIENFQKGKV